MKFKTKFILIIVIMALIFGAISTVFNFILKNNMISEYHEIYNSSAAGINSQFKGFLVEMDITLLEAKAGLPEHPEEPFDEGLEIYTKDLLPIGYDFLLIQIGGKIYFISESKVESPALRADFAMMGDFRVVALNQVFAVADSSRYLIRTTAIAGGNLVLFKSMDSVASALNRYDFENIIIVGADGSMLYSYDEGLSLGALLQNQNNVLIDSFNEGDSFSYNLTLAGESKIVTFAGRDDYFSGIRVAAYRPESELNSRLSTVSVNDWVEAISLILVSAACFVLFAIIYNRQFEEIKRNKNRNIYIFKADLNGRLIARSDSFKEDFGSEKIDPESYVYSNLERPVILELENKEGLKRNLACSIDMNRKRTEIVGVDLTEILEDYKRLQNMEKTNILTGLPNAENFDDYVTNKLTAGQGIQGLFAVIQNLSLERYKVLLGKYMYEQAITEYASAISTVLWQYGKIYSTKDNDILFFIEDMNVAEKFIFNIDSIMEKLNKPIKVNKTVLMFDVQAGFVLIGQKTTDITISKLHNNAQIALNRSKSSPSINHYLLRLTDLDINRTDFTEKGMVERMIEAGEVDVFFQPQYEYESQRVVSFEALTRLVSNKNKEINVAEFIEIAENYGGMMELGKFVYEKAMDFAITVQDQGISISVNVSPLQIMQMGFVEEFLKAFDERKLKPGSINIEVTEGIMLQQINEVAEKLKIFKKRGIGTHLDDFGVAYSTMLYLKLLPITALKVDKSLVDDISERNDSQAIVKSIVELTKDLNILCIAEGVSSKTQFDQLRNLGCDVIQGFFIGKAMSGEEATHIIKEKLNFDENDDVVSQ